MTVIGRLILITIAIAVVAGCTRIPVNHNFHSEAPARPVVSDSSNSGVLQLVSDARLGEVLTYLDSNTGLASVITVQSEYFSANGRSCRRYTQHQSNQATASKKLACMGSAGWQEIPVASIVD